MEILKSFLVNLGFRVERTGERQFVESVGKTTARVAELGVALEAVGTAVAAVVTVMADKFEDLYYASQRIGSSVENIRSFGFAIGQMGGKADQAQSSLEAIAEFMRSNPGGSSFINSLGVATKDANGELRDTAEILADLAKPLQKMPYFAAKQYAGILGIDDRTLQAMLRDQGQMRENLERQKRIYREAGVNQQAFALQGRNFANAVREVKARVGALGEAVFMNLSTRVMPVLERFGAWVEKNGPLIATRLTHLLEGVFDIAVTIGRVVVKAVDAMIKLDHATGGLSTALLGLLAAWRILNLGVLATPLGAAIGAVTALAAAVALLIEDFNTWRNGGASAFDWTGFVNGAKAVMEFLKPLTDAFVAFWDQLSRAVMEASTQVISAFSDLLTALGPFGDWLKGVGAQLLTLAAALIQGLGPPVAALIGGTMRVIADVIKTVADIIRVITDLLRGDWASAWRDAGKVVADVIHAILDEFRTLIHAAHSFWDALNGKRDDPSIRSPERQRAEEATVDPKAHGVPNTTQTDRDRQGNVTAVRKYDAKGDLASDVRTPPKRAPVAHPENRSILDQLRGWVAGERRASPEMPQPQSHPRGPEFIGNGASMVGARAQQMAQQAIAYFVSQGWSHAQASGIAANIQRESGFNPQARNSIGMQGLAQWDTKRRARFAEWAGHDLSASSFKEQLEYIQHELTQGMEKSAGNRLRRTTTARQAGVAVNDGYERNGSAAEAQARGDLAERFDTAAPQPDGARVVNINQKTDVHVAGSGAEETGRAVAREQGRVNADLTRSTRSVVR